MSTVLTNLTLRRDAQVEYLGSQKAKCFQGLAGPVAECMLALANLGSGIPASRAPRPEVAGHPHKGCSAEGRAGPGPSGFPPAPRTERPGCGGRSRVRAAERLAASARRSRAPPAPCALPPSSERGPAAATRVGSGSSACALRRGPVVLAPVPTHLDLLADPSSSL